MWSALVNLVAGTMAVLFSVAFVFCARGMIASERIRLEKRPINYSLYSQEGSLLFVRSEAKFLTPEAADAYLRFFNLMSTGDTEWRWSVTTDLPAFRSPASTVAGFGYEFSEGEAMGRIFRSGIRREQTLLRIPMWFILGCLGIWPGVRFWRQSKLRTERQQKGLCLKCGFNLQGIYHHCPKCGTRAPIPTGFPVHLWSN